MNGSTTIITILIVAVVLILCCCCIAGAIMFGLVFSIGDTNIDFNLTPGVPGQGTPTPLVIRPTQQPTPDAAATATPSVDTPEVTPGQGETPSTPPTDEPARPVGGAEETLRTLQDTIVPVNDVRDLAMRLEGIEDIPETLEPPAAPLQVGTQDKFWVNDTDTNENFQVDATLRYVTDHVYFWVQNGVNYNERDLRDLVETFENDIYPTNREFFGSEWSPGVDGDPHLYILFTRGMGSNVAGYFSSADEYTPLAHEYSNAHEMFLLSADGQSLGDEYSYSVLAHEFQHMIHWYGDRNETSWLNEGFSELAVFLNGYGTGGFDWLYTQSPDMQLTDWGSDIGNNGPHYGASFLFVTYFLDRFSDEATKALVVAPENGMDSVDHVLEELGITDPLTGNTALADDVFLDWTIANYLLDDEVGDGRYTYTNYSGVSQAGPTEEVSRCPGGQQTRDVNNYGVDYILISCEGSYNLHFEGSMQVPLLPEDAYSGNYAFWSNKGDESDMTLTRTFDFTDVSGPLTLSYWTWYDLEEDYDYLYLEASFDGESWQILTTPSGTAEDPSGNSYGWGYNGYSGNGPEWIYEEVDISQFAGQEVQLRFEYVTDAAVNGEGLLLDDVSVPEIGYSTDFEQDEGGWEAAGFARIQNTLPQNFRLAVISHGNETTVEYITLNDDLSADIELTIGGDVDEVTLVVTGTTRFTRQKAAYRFEIQ